MSAVSLVPGEVKPHPAVVNALSAPGIIQLYSLSPCLHHLPAPATTSTLGCSTSLISPHCWDKGAAPHPNSAQLIPVPPGSRLKPQSPDPPLPCRVRSASAAPGAGRAALFPVDVPAQQDESDTPVGVLSWLRVHSYIGKPESHRAAGRGWHSHPCAEGIRGGRGGVAALGHPSGAGW